MLKYFYMSLTKATSRVIDDNAIGTAQLSAQAVTEAKIADSAVTANKLSTTLQQTLLPVGAVQAFARTTAPSGWLTCNGAAIPTTGTVQGIAASSLTDLRNMLLADSSPFGTSSGNPLLPDLRGYFIRGSGTNTDGTAAGTFGAKTADAIKTHTHTVAGTTGNDSPDHAHAGYTDTQGNHKHTVVGKQANDVPSGAGSRERLFGMAFEGEVVNIPDSGEAFTAGAHAHNTQTYGAQQRHQHGFSVTSGDPSTGTSSETYPKNIALLYCIKF